MGALGKRERKNCPRELTNFTIHKVVLLCEAAAPESVFMFTFNKIKVFLGFFLGLVVNFFLFAYTVGMLTVKPLLSLCFTLTL